MSVAPADQTRGDSTVWFDGDGVVRLSRNEVATLCMKAGRGAGMAWGLAEEAGYAVGWLTDRGIDGAEELLAHLDAAQDRGWADLCPRIQGDRWQAPKAGAICPIALGAALCDHAALPEGPAPGCILHIGSVNHPVLILAFLADIATTRGASLLLEWDGGSVCAGGHYAPLEPATRTLCGRRGLALRLTVRDGLAPPDPPAGTPALRIHAATIAALNAFA
ncbi:MAG: DUF3726 domain-containing protein, partial [Jannaschia sp.]